MGISTNIAHKKMIADADKIAKLYEGGVPISQIAEIEGVTFSTISKHLEMLGLRLRKLRGVNYHPVNPQYHYYKRNKAGPSKELQAQRKINTEINKRLVKHVKVDNVGEDARMIRYACGMSI